MRRWIGIASLGAALALTAASAQAEVSYPGGYRDAAVSYRTAHAGRSLGWRRHARYGLPAAYGAVPVFYPGTAGAAPFGPVGLSLYREAYIGRGLVYNTPPEPVWPSREVISVRY